MISIGIILMLYIILVCQYWVVSIECMNGYVKTKKDFVIFLIPFSFIYVFFRNIKNFWRKLK